MCVCEYKGENGSYLQLEITLKHKGKYKLTNYFLKPSNVAVLSIGRSRLCSLHPPGPNYFTILK